jgi:peptidoglycan/xylan/chitin deacetylase (PgdA/CDA1 family)/3D (Asp-Asp-Asp) domain-containing protein
LLLGRARNILLLLGIIITMIVLSLQSLGQPNFRADALMYNNNNIHNCTNGWNITGYFTPIERDYVSLKKEIISVQGVGNIGFNSEFLSDVTTEGWGKTNLGWYLGFYDNAWHKSYDPLSANGQPLRIGMVATDPSVISTGSLLSSITLPYPWNLQTFKATDAGPGVRGKHIDVYTGEGKVAQTNTIKITGQGKMVCFVIEPNIINNNRNITPCNCVIFRMDDIQDYWLEQGQLAPMDLFISKNQSLSLGLIMHAIGNDSKIINKVREGYQKGLFELALHGWDHIDYSQLSEQKQHDSLQNANEKMRYLFGTTSRIFIPPLDPFNNDTLKATGQLGLQILSSVEYEDNYFDHNNSIFVADGKTPNNGTIYHVPGTILFKDYVNGSWVTNPINKILNALSANIKKYGYGVVVLHPQDFVKSGIYNEKLIDILDQNETKELSSLVNLLLSKNIHIVSFSKLIGYST